MSEFVKVNMQGVDHTVYLDKLPDVLPEGKVYWFVCDEVVLRKDVTMVRYDGTLKYEDLKEVLMGYVEYNILALHATPS